MFPFAPSFWLLKLRNFERRVESASPSITSSSSSSVSSRRAVTWTSCRSAHGGADTRLWWRLHCPPPVCSRRLVPRQAPAAPTAASVSPTPDGESDQDMTPARESRWATSQRGRCPRAAASTQQLGTGGVKHLSGRVSERTRPGKRRFFLLD